jgi:hypothetical protein
MNSSSTLLAAASRLDALLAAIQPSPSSEFRRLTIAHYICGVIKRCFQQHHQVRVVGVQQQRRGTRSAITAAAASASRPLPISNRCALPLGPPNSAACLFFWKGRP